MVSGACEDGTRKWQPDGLQRDLFVLDPTAEAGDQAFILTPTDRCVVSNLGELDVMRADDATDQHGQCV